MCTIGTMYKLLRDIPMFWLIDWKFYLKLSNILSNTYYFRWPSHSHYTIDISFMLRLFGIYICTIYTDKSICDMCTIGTVYRLRHINMMCVPLVPCTNWDISTWYVLCVLLVLCTNCLEMCHCVVCSIGIVYKLFRDVPLCCVFYWYCIQTV